MADESSERLNKLIEQDRKRGAAYRKRRNQKGQVRIAVWVPKHRADELRKIAQAMCLEKPRAKSSGFGAPVVPVSGKSPGWSYIKVEPDEAWLQMMLKANKATWQNKTKKHPNTWRIRSDLVKEMGLEKRVVATESASPNHAKKAAKKPAERKKVNKAKKKATRDQTK